MHYLGTPLMHPAIAWHLRRIFGMSEDRNFKFGKRIYLHKLYLMDDKIPP